MTDNDLFWIDLETTGLNPLVDRVLEVAVYRSKLSNPFVAEKLYENVLHFDREALGAPHIDPYVGKMHGEGKLWSACAASKVTYARVVADLADIIPAVVDPTARPILAGSTIHFDRDFIRRQFDPIEPLSVRFHHRHYDVSAIKLFCESLGMPKIPKGEAHRAAADVEESIKHAAECAEWLRAWGFTEKRRGLQMGCAIDGGNGASIEITNDSLIIKLDDRAWTDLLPAGSMASALAVLFQRLPTGPALRAMVDAMLTKLGR